MFESALIAHAGQDRQVDLGLLAETIFFYRSAHLLLSRSSVIALASQIPVDDLIALLNRASLKLTYVRPAFCVVSAGVPRVHQFVAITLAGNQQRQITDYREEISAALERKIGASNETKRLVHALTRRMPLYRFKGFREKEEIVPSLARRDAFDKKFVRDAAITILKHLVPSFEVPADFRFELFDTGQGYAVDTNIDFQKLNSLYHQHTPPSHSTISAEYLLAHISDARADSFFAASYMAEIVTGPVYSDLIRLKHFDFLRRRDANVSELDLFQESVVQNVPSIREAINLYQVPLIRTRGPSRAVRWT